MQFYLWQIRIKIGNNIFKKRLKTTPVVDICTTSKNVSTIIWMSVLYFPHRLSGVKYPLIQLACKSTGLAR